MRLEEPHQHAEHGTSSSVIAFFTLGYVPPVLWTGPQSGSFPPGRRGQRMLRVPGQEKIVGLERTRPTSLVQLLADCDVAIARGSQTRRLMLFHYRLGFFSAARRQRGAGEKDDG